MLTIYYILDGKIDIHHCTQEFLMFCANIIIASGGDIICVKNDAGEVIFENQY